MTVQSVTDSVKSTIVFWNMTLAKRPCCSPAARFTISAARPKNVRPPVKQTTASISPRRITDPMKTVSPGPRVTGSDSPVSAAWSTSRALPPSSLQSAGTMSPSLTLRRSPGTSVLASTERNAPDRFTDARGASESLSAAMASPALFSSKKPTVPLTTWSVRSTPKSSQSPSTATTAVAAQIMMGMGPQKKLRKMSSSLRFASSSTFGPNSSSRFAASASARPSGPVAMANSMARRSSSSRLGTSVLPDAP
mmetsp:Transcript_9108/g.31245  ORF Transcript_9108/g.31245 Transcript_9108/m.31245 type:complete len:251 (+) Transcript_9108:2073-2825(+)